MELDTLNIEISLKRRGKVGKLQGEVLSLQTITVKKTFLRQVIRCLIAETKIKLLKFQLCHVKSFGSGFR